jgi:hypothetical protein
MLDDHEERPDYLHAGLKVSIASLGELNPGETDG